MNSSQAMSVNAKLRFLKVGGMTECQVLWCSKKLERPVLNLFLELVPSFFTHRRPRLTCMELHAFTPNVDLKREFKLAALTPHWQKLSYMLFSKSISIEPSCACGIGIIGMGIGRPLRR